MGDSIKAKKTKDTITLNGKELSNFLIRGIFDLATGTPRPGTLVALKKSININQSIQQQAFELIKNSFEKGVKLQSKIDLKTIYDNKDVSKELESKEYVLPHTIFQNPESAPFVDDLAILYNVMLRQTSFSESTIEGFVKSFPKSFGDALISIVQDETEKYSDLIKWVNNPVTETIYLRSKRGIYQAELAQKYLEKDVKVNGRKTSIAQIYCEPSFLKYDATDEFCFQEEIPESPENYLKNDFLNRSDKRILIILGSIASGKTLFCLKSIKALQEDSKIIAFYIQLKDIDKNTFLASRAFDMFMKKLPTKTQPANWVAGEKSIFFLDGLDELSMENGISDDDIIAFLSKCQEFITNYPNSFIVITSRPNFIENNKLSHLNRELVLLKTNKFNTNWENYINLDHRNLITNISVDVELEYIQELINQPYWAQTLDSIFSKSDFYDRLFEQLLNRQWDKTKRNSKFKDNLSAQVFKQLISYVSFLQLKSHKKYIQKDELIKDSKINGFISQILKIVPTDANKSVRQILTSFYFEEVQLNGNLLGISISHEKLYQYLACEYIWEQLCHIYIPSDDDSTSQDSIIEQTKELFSYIQFTDELNNNFHLIISSQSEQKRNDLAKGMKQKTSLLLRYGFMKEYSNSNTPEITPDQKILNTFYGFNLILGMLKLQQNGHSTPNLIKVIKQHLEEEKKCKIKKDEEDGEMSNDGQMALFQEIIDAHSIGPKYINNLKENFRLRILGQEIFKQKVKAPSNNIKKYTQYIRLSFANNHPKKLDLSYMDLKNQNIRGLYGARTNFKGANFLNAILKDSNLSESDLEHCMLSLASLENANLREAKFENSILNFAKLQFANLIKANFNKTWLFGADLSQTSSSYCLFANAYLPYSNLSDADFRNANFEGTYLAYSDFSNADFTGAKFYDANMHEVVLYESILMYAEFNNATMTNVDFTNIDLSFAHLEGTNLEGATLNNTNLTNAIFDEDTNLTGAKVLEMNWVDLLSEWGVSGAEEIMSKYQVNHERQTFTKLDGTTWKGYKIEKIENDGHE